jgi:two-component system, NtrC family, response regulator AtoC
MRILLIDDDQLSLESLKNFLNVTLGHKVYCAASCEQGLVLQNEQSFPLIISDIKMAGMDGISLLEQLKSDIESKNTEVILMSAYATLDCCLDALRSKAYDFFLKPLNIRRLAEVIQNYEAGMNAERKLTYTQSLPPVSDVEEIKHQKSLINLPGIGKVGIHSEEMRSIRDYALKLHLHRGVPVMIEGETGTGKEIVARLIHYGYQGNKINEMEFPFVSLNCSAISPNLFESELFGYERGAFTGADPKGKAGKLEIAAKGTLFLDEIGDMPLDFQPKLLRVLQEREYFRISGNRKMKFEARIICATNNNLKELVEQRKFRRDLYYRLNTAYIEIPPLRKRKNDIVPLAQIFLDDMRKSQPDKFMAISETAKTILENLHWQGNVRELRSVMERIFLRFDDVILRAGYIEGMVEEFTDNYINAYHIDLPEDGINLDLIERDIVTRVMKLHDNNITQAAKYLKISRNRLKRIYNL